MSPLTSPDAKAVVRALEALTTQVRRIADRRTTPVVEDAEAQQTTPDDASRCVCRHPADEHSVYGCADDCACEWVPRRQAPAVDEDGPRTVAELMRCTCDYIAEPWISMDHRPDCPVRPAVDEDAPSAACRIMETRTCPPSYNGPCGNRPCARFESDDPGPWTEQQPKVLGMTVGIDPSVPPGAVEFRPAAEEQTLQWARRESLLVLLTRLQRGRTLTEDEAATLRHHVETEIREATIADAIIAETKRLLERRTETLRKRAKRAEHERDVVAADLETADRIRAEAQRDRDQHAAVLREILGRFTPALVNGKYAFYQAEEPVPVEELERWRSVVAPTVERPWWETLAEARAELEETKTAIEQVRSAAHLNRRGLLSTEELHAVIGPPTALDSTEQPRGCRCHNGDEVCSGCRRCPDICNGCDGPEYQPTTTKEN